MRRSMPTLGVPTRRSKNRGGKLMLLVLMTGAGVGAYFWYKRRPVEAPDAPQIAVVGVPGAAGTGVDAGALAAAPPTPPPPEDPVRKAGFMRVSARIDGPLETAIVNQVGPDIGVPLTQVVTRSLVWWVSVPGDLRRGDAIDVLFAERANEEPVVHAVRFSSGKNEKVFEAYRFKAQGETFPRFYMPNGEELEERLQDSPIDSYEQITSLLRDGRKHKGVDFKAPTGTPIKAPFNGTITRKNWNWRGNGNCIELKEDGGDRRVALFLHLSELPATLKVGQRVAKGEVLASSGNTGRSFAPHLHYQLETLAGKPIDPFKSHTVYRRALPAAERPALDAEMARLSGLLSTPVAGK